MPLALLIFARVCMRFARLKHAQCMRVHVRGRKQQTDTHTRTNIAASHVSRSRLQDAAGRKRSLDEAMSEGPAGSDDLRCADYKCVCVGVCVCVCVCVFVCVYLCVYALCIYTGMRLLALCDI